MLTHASPPSRSLREAVNAFAAESLDGWSDSALSADLIAIRRESDRLEGEFLRRLHRFDRSHGALADGAVSTVSWLRANCGVTGGVAAHRVHMARVLADLPKVTDSLCAGRASFTNIGLITRLADDVGTESARTVEDTLVTAAEQLDSARMRYLALFTRMRLDADGALDQDNKNHDRRWFACDQTFGGVFVVRGELDAEGGAILKTAIDALCAPYGSDDGRTGSQRRADALVDLASRQLQDGAVGSVHGQRPHLTLTASIEALRRDPGAEPAEVGGIGPVHTETARRLACDAVCTVLTVASAAQPTPIGALPPGLKPLSVGRATRIIPPHPHRTARTRQGVSLPKLRPSTGMDGRPPHSALDG